MTESPDTRNFFDTALCDSRQNCATCRTSAEWRAMLFDAGLVEEVEFRCPHGFTQDRLPRAFRMTVRRRDCRACPPVEVVFYERRARVELATAGLEDQRSAD